MNCDYCGWHTGAVARWEVTTGAPGDGMTRYPCDEHLASAYRHVAQKGEVTVIEHNRGYTDRGAARVGDVARSFLGMRAREAA